MSQRASSTLGVLPPPLWGRVGGLQDQRAIAHPHP